MGQRGYTAQALRKGTENNGGRSLCVRRRVSLRIGGKIGGDHSSETLKE